MMRFNSYKFLRKNFTDPNYLCDLLAAYGLEVPQRATAEKWFTRKGIPGRWIPPMVCALELETGGPIMLSDYLDRGQ